MEYPKFIKRLEAEESAAAHVANADEHLAQLIGWHGEEEGRAQFESLTAKPAKKAEVKPDIEDERTEDEIKADLHALLDAREIKYDKRWGVDKLKAALEE